ncbi:MAG TPA: hypothetical protein VGH28_02885 [Polyangiaceae bacterium]
MRKLLVAGFLAASACFFPSLDGLGGAATDGGADVTEAGPDAGPGPLASAGSVATETGNAQQTHLVWAAGAKRWWLFYIDDDTTHLKTRSSADFVTWTDGASLTLAHPTGGEGRNFSVAYASVAGADVVHVAFSHAEPSLLTHSHTRAIISGSAITFGLPVDMGAPVSSAADQPDGVATLVAPDGSVWDSTGFTFSVGTTSGHFNEDVFAASVPETGAGSWDASFAQTTVEVVGQESNARAFVYDGAPVAFWEDGVDEPDPTNLHFAAFAGGGWTSVQTVFATDAPQDPNDWGVAVLRAGSLTETHAVRATASGSYDHELGATSPSAGAAPPPNARTPGSGVVLLSDPAHLAAFTLGADGSVQRSRWDGAQFGAWESLAPARTRAYLSGYCPDLAAHPEAGSCALIWTEPASGGYEVDGMRVSTGP